MEIRIVKDKTHPLKAYPRGTVWHTSHHYAPDGLVSWPVCIEPDEMTSEDIDIAVRLLTSFNAAIAFEKKNIRPENRPNDGMWEMLKHECHGETYKILHSNDPERLAKHLCSLSGKKMLNGLGLGESYNVMRDDAPIAAHLIIDKIIALAEAFGLISYENPEQGLYGTNIYLDLEELVCKIEDHIGVPFTRKKCMGIFGIKVGGRIIEPKLVGDAYASMRIQELANQCRLLLFI